MSLDYAGVRNGLGLSQEEFAILLGVPVGSVRNWEQDNRSPGCSTTTLYALVETKNPSVLEVMLTIACKKNYKSLKSIKVLKGVVAKICDEPLMRSLLEVTIMSSNQQFTPEQLGFKTVLVKN